MRHYLAAAYAMLTKDASDTAKLDRLLDEPFPHELSAAERRLRAARRVADANRAAVAMLDRSGARAR